MTEKTVDAYIASLAAPQAEIVTALRQLVRATVPAATESIKWAQPVYEHNGPLCYLKAFKHHVNFGFWRGAELPDPHGLLASTGSKMAHVKIAALGDIRKKAFQDFLRAAVKLNQAKGDPTRGG